MIEIDGSFGEGGGQILRTSLTLSALTGKAIKVYNIRANRPNPGLQHQHLTAVKLMKYLTDAETKGDFINSMEILFTPKEIKREGKLEFNVGTAGSVTLIANTIIPLLINSRLTITLTGGTDVPKSPTFDYMRLVFLKILENIGVNGKIELIKRGHYPKGGGAIRLFNFQGNPGQFDITELGRVEIIKGISHASSLPSHVAERQITGSKEVLDKLGVTVEIEADIREGESVGSGITLAAYGKSVMGSDSLGEKGKRAEIVGREAATKLMEDLKSGGAIDRYMSDMLMLYASIYGGKYTG
ncbi:RNA 3'-terminal phosphate cyclase, partial [Acidianus sp. RZ1]